MKRITFIILTIITGFITAIAILLMLFFLLGITPTIVISGSMDPKIPVGSLCFINTRYPYKKLKKNDIIVYKFQQNQVIHRVIRVTERGLETKGDANDFSDRISTTEKNYYGKYLFSIPGIGFVITKFQSTIGKITFVGVILILYIMEYLFFIDRNKNYDK